MKLITHDVYKDILALKFTNKYIFIIDLKTSMIPFKKKTVAGEDDEDDDEESIVPVVEFDAVNNDDLIYIGHNKDQVYSERLYSFKLFYVNSSSVLADAHFYLNNMT